MTRRLRTAAAASLAVVVLAGATGPALAQVPLDTPLDEHSAKRVDRLEKAMKELRAIVFQGRETGAPVVVQPAETQGQIAALGDKVGDVNQTLARLNGQLEVIRHDLDQLRQEVADLRASNAVLKDQVASLQRGPQPATPPALAGPGATGPLAPAAAAPPPGQDPSWIFASAKSAFMAGDNATAEAGFRDYVDRYGDGPGGPEARYYLAKTLRARRAWPDAATASIGAIRGWPQTRWAPDAVLDLSKSLVNLGKPADACQTLGELARRYPKASPTVLKAARAVRLKAQCE